MGYKGVRMEIVLSKLMVVGQGGSLPLQQDPDESDRCIAKLVNLFRYTLGGHKGVAAFKPHFVLYTAGAFYTMEEVTSGFSLMLVYSLCLPLDLRFIRGTNGSDLLRLELADNIMKLLRPEKQLRLYVARLQYEIPDCYGRWDQKKAVESATWYTVRGEKLGSGSPFPVTWTTSFNFLNPGKEPLGQLWKSGDGEFVCRYERLAIVGWPASADIRNTHRFMGEAAAADSVFMDEPVDLARLQMLLRYDADQGNQGNGKQVPCRSGQTVSKAPVSLACCKNLCKAIVESDDILLVDVFFKKFFSRLGQKRELISSLADIVHKFGWEIVNATYVQAFDGLPYSVSMGLVLKLADALVDLPSVAACLTILAVKKADTLFVPTNLWSLVFRDVGNVFTRLEAKIIGPVVQSLSKCASASSSLEHRKLLQALATRRRQWLMDRIAETEKPFAWEIVDMNFVGATGMAAFLQGPNTSYQVRCFKDDGGWQRARCVRACNETSRQVHPEDAGYSSIQKRNSSAQSHSC
ncbi:uncharacterized protein PITG_03230 [Phytophthora infestans T30-4]|uniref:Uncharacterized protein n=1 Tax=Phytophthora infestans (strain T30-4) TaxID=403677 RepID=D0MZP8_PHYIT|nr:uncharacterized protein PITG_03230 [Phytophthora infestans T30-4]EEY65711.1 conserved hypothetical protein [Phytophthora infestans T30-4]|eukprot:XP_002906310.1 conserved hypothetical protein [Phytophthora infestans T30-4]